MSSRLLHKLRSLHKLLPICAAAVAFAVPASACGPYFPNQLLFDSGESAAWAPVADFRREIERIAPAQSAWRARPPGESDSDRQGIRADVFDATAAVDLADLGDALAATHARDKRRVILFAYELTRRDLTEYARSVSDARERGAARPPPPDIKIPPGLPAEFELYLRGVLSYQRQDMPTARKQWTALLALPAAQRRYRTVWAQFMIGKSYLVNDSPLAAAAFARVRDLAKAGNGDSLGLAASSLGWEARAQLDQHRPAKAISLYLEQFATGDPTAIDSLAQVSADLFKRNDLRTLQDLARDPESCRVLTAYTLWRGGVFREAPKSPVVMQWLAALEAAGADKIVGAERLAWSAYQAGDMPAAARWVAKARDDDPIALWVRAKLQLRSGKLAEAAALLARVARAFPEDERWDAPGAYDPRDISVATFSPHARAIAEMGVLQLARGNYVDSLDQLLKAGWWRDAAYVAERVLTVDELIAYVDRNCPEGKHDKLRYLLARRLTRNGRWKAARPYFPEKLRPRLDAYIGAIRDGHDAKLTRVQRGESLWIAAKIARKEGLELLGTELSPDDFADSGEFPGDGLPETREKAAGRETQTAGAHAKAEQPKAPPAGAVILPPLSDELRRVERSAVRPAKRWHYRFIAADHAWAAAQLLPDESDALAELLCEAGGWIKADDPKAADRFYKALVRRCGTTPLGRAASKKHWFPDSKPKPHKQGDGGL